MNRQEARSRASTQPVAPPRTTLRGRQLLAAKATWVVVTILTVGLSVAAIPLAYEYLIACATDQDLRCPPNWSLVPPGVPAREGVNALEELSLSVEFYAAYRLATEVVFMLGFWAMGAVIFWKRSDDRVALLFSLMLVTFGAANIVQNQELFTGFSPALVLLRKFVYFLGAALFFVSFFVFPDGRFVPRWGRWPVVVVTIYMASLIFLPDYSPLNLGAGPPLLTASVVVSLLGTMVFAQVYRYLRVSGPVERQQIKWVVFGLAAAVPVSIVAELLLPVAARFQPDDSNVPYILAMLAKATVGNFSSLLIPVSISVAILRYRLWDIDFIINRTLVYGALTASVIGSYALVEGLLSTLLQELKGRVNFAIYLMATGLIAVLLAPLRDRLQRGVNYLMYGERDDPYGVLSRLGQRLEATLTPDAVLPTIVETIAEALKLPYAAISLKQGDEFKTAAAYGSPTSDPTVMPLVYQKETIGLLVLAPRAPGEPFSPADHRLLGDLARQAEVAVHAVRLTADLQRSRERLVTAREEERRRLRRDLHDGLGPDLASLTLKHDAARNLLAHDPAAVGALLAELKVQTQAAIEDIRRLVYDLRPPALDDLGLVPAIREQAINCGLLCGSGEEAGHKDGVVCSIEAPEHLPQLSAAVEVAAYRIVQEAMTNVARHARARTCRIRLSLEDELELEITDDGVGLPADRNAGVGMTSMRERAAELGGTCVIHPVPTGGTRVLARLPLPASEERQWTAPASS